MQIAHIHYFPLAWPFVVFLAGLFLGLVVMIQLGAVQSASPTVGSASASATS